MTIFKGYSTKALLALYAAAWIGAVAAEPIPLENFARQMEYDGAVLSPNGKYIVIERTADEGKSLVAVLRTKDLKLISHLPATTGTSPINPRWISNERLVVELTEGSKLYENEWANGELVAINADGNLTRKIIEHQAFVTGGEDERLNRLHGFARVVHTLPDDEKKSLSLSPNSAGRSAEAATNCTS